MSWQAQTKLVKVITRLPQNLEFHFDRHDCTIHALCGDMQLPTKEEFEEIVTLWRAYYDTVPPEHVDQWNVAMSERFPEISKRPLPRAGYVYLAYAETGHYKIGLSIGPVERIRVFDTKMPVKVSLIHTIPATDMYTAERSLHKTFSKKLHEGEWFSLEQKDVDYICSISSCEDGEFII